MFYWTDWNTIFPCEFCWYIQLFYLKTHVSGSFLDWRKNETNHKIRERTHFITIAVIYFDNLTWYSSKNANLVKRCLQKQPPEVFCKKHVLRNSVKLTGKHLCQSFFFNKVAGLSHPEVFYKKGALRNFAKFTGKQLCLQLFWKRDSGTGAFLWVLRNF